MKPLETPILLLTFNRPECTERVFNRIREVRPRTLYLASDGARPRIAGEPERVEMVRQMVLGRVDWPCAVHTRFSEHNLGCKAAVATAIDWFFDHVPMGIILEDDCLPDSSFFDFCTELLARYQNDPAVMMISGNQFIPESKMNALQESYYFTNLPHIWGWATWRRAWNQYDPKLSEWPRNRSMIRKYVSLDFLTWLRFSKAFSRVKAGQIDTWDHQWTYSIWKERGLSICPKYNLVSNIGFGESATHTRNGESSLGNMPVHRMEWPLKHPLQVKINRALTRESTKWVTTPLGQKVRFALKKVLQKIKTLP